MKPLLTILLTLFLISCNKETEKPVITITPTLTTENGKWVINLSYSDTINTQGFVRFYWVVSDANKKQYKWFGAIPLEQPQISQKYNSAIPSFYPYTLDSLVITPDDYLNKYIILIKE